MHSPSERVKKIGGLGLEPRQLTRDLALLCERIRAMQPRLPDGRRLTFSIADAERPILHVQDQAVA